MAPPIKQLQADPVVVKELQRRSRSATIAVRDRGRADIVLLRLDGLGVEVGSPHDLYKTVGVDGPTASSARIGAVSNQDRSRP